MKKLCLTLVLAFAGCATIHTPSDATFQQKLLSNVEDMKTIVAHVKEKCGEQYVSLAPVIMSALQVFLTPQDVLNDIMAVVNAAPTLYADGKALACAIQTVIDDLKALKPKAGSPTALMLETAQQVQLLAQAYNSAPNQCAASR